MSDLEFERIYLNQSIASGRVRIAASGLGWKSKEKKPFLLPSSSIISAQWSRASKGYELRLQTRDNEVVMLDGFDQSNFNQLRNELKRHLNIDLEQRDHILRGWNWGTTTMARSELIFNINNRPDFELPYKTINNTNLTGKNEVTVEFRPDDEGDKEGDELVEMRFYVPGTVAVKEDDGEDTKKGEEDEDAEKGEEEQSAATHFYEQLKEKASIGQVSGDAIVSFSDVFFLTPRGRYDLDMYASSLRLRGKTYDNKVQFRAIERIFSLPKPDDVHHLVVVQVDPPLTQGQTRYSFLTMQFPREELMDVELNIPEEEYDAKYKDKLKRSFEDEKTHTVISQCFKGLTDRRITIPSSFVSKHGQVAVSCSLKASEGYLYFLDKCILFVIKPTVYIPFSEVASVQLSRIGQSSTVSKTFDLEVNFRNGSSQVFGNIARDEQQNINSFLVEKGIKVKNEEEEGKKMLNAALGDDSGSDAGPGDVDDDDDDESEDEDFNEEDVSDDDVPEEFDSGHEDSGSESESDSDKPAKKKAKK
ncbi:FACT complex subunit [Saccharomycopsis crataegensis]|uniref:FACT complex subunit POB3 n=1 Tax=Saccharomycopsis crataegensis TaxID=43959 RepID=A0AAV5QN35_9ASCO|nr:FACT complex subunit [Saccharomycopsis crataegensis]